MATLTKSFDSVAVPYPPAPKMDQDLMEQDLEALLKDALERLAAADMVAAYANQSKLQEVHKVDQVTPEWLTEVLAPDVPGAQIVKLQEAYNHEGMTSRHNLEITWNEEGAKHNLPPAVFIKATPENPHLLEMLSLLHMAELECRFYNACSKDLEGLIPKCYYARSYPGGRFIILLEDLAKRGSKGHWMADTCSIEYAKQVAIAQGKIHATYWNSPRFQTDMVFVRPRCVRFGEQWVRTMFNSVHAKFLASEIAADLPEYVRDLVKRWDEVCPILYKYWDSKPPTLVHGDSHLGNVLENSDGTAGYYDWQCLFRGYGFRDLSYFLMSALTVEDVKEHERAIFDLYVDTLQSRGVTVNREEAWLDYCLLCFQRFDSTMTSLTQGGYGHARHALERQLRTITYVVQSRDIRAMLEKVVATGSLI